MTADQIHALTQFRLDQLWPERSRSARKEVTMTSDQLQATVTALQMRHRMDIDATREGESVPKLDQVDIEATREREALPKVDLARIQRAGIAVTSDGLRMVIAKSVGDKNEAEGVGQG